MATWNTALFDLKGAVHDNAASLRDDVVYHSDTRVMRLKKKRYNRAARSFFEFGEFPILASLFCQFLINQYSGVGCVFPE